MARKSNFSRAYEIFLIALIGARKNAGYTQNQIADRLNQTQSWVSKVERGERRIDVIEYVQSAMPSGPAFQSL